MPRASIIVAIEPLCYADAIGAVMSRLRPQFAVNVVEPEELLEHAESRSPRLVLCSRANPFGPDGPEWLEYYPYAEEPEVELRVNGEALKMRKIDFDRLLDIVDSVLRLQEPAQRTLAY